MRMILTLVLLIVNKAKKSKPTVMKNLPEIIRYFSNLSPIIPIIVFLTSKNQNFKGIKIITVLVFTSFLVDVTTFIAGLRHVSLFSIANIFFVIQFLLLSRFYSSLSGSKKYYYLLVPFIAFFIFNTIFIQPIHTYQSWLRVAGGFIYICYSVSYYIQVLKVKPHIDPIYHFPPFWLNTAIFYYFSFNFFLFIISSYVFTNMSIDTMKAFWSFHNFNNIIKNILFAVGIYWAGRTKILTS